MKAKKPVSDPFGGDGVDPFAIEARGPDNDPFGLPPSKGKGKKSNPFGGPANVSDPFGEDPFGKVLGAGGGGALDDDNPFL